MIIHGYFDYCQETLIVSCVSKILRIAIRVKKKASDTFLRYTAVRCLTLSCGLCLRLGADTCAGNGDARIKPCYRITAHNGQYPGSCC